MNETFICDLNSYHKLPMPPPAHITIYNNPLASQSYTLSHDISLSVLLHLLLQRNNIQMMHGDTFCNLKDFNYIRNALEDIRLDGNPINLSRTPQAYVCLPRIPIGDLI